MTETSIYTEKQELASIYSDLYKDVYGFRPRGVNFNAMSVEEIQEELDYLSDRLDTIIADEKAEAARRVEEFKALVAKTIEHGAKDEETALRWLTQGDEFYHGQCVESWVWDKGILFTDYGRELVTKLNSIVTYKEYI